MRVGVVDCGTNTIRLLIADAQIGDDGVATLADVTRILRFVRLGQEVDEKRTFHPQALVRTLAAVDEFAELIAKEGPLDDLRFIATSAARDVDNCDVLFDGVAARLAVRPEIATGEEEARWSFLGALAGGQVPPGPVLVMDIGGGSTELILGDADGTINQASSIDIGSVRLRERYLADDPPSGRQVAEARQYVDSLVDEIAWLAGQSLSCRLTYIGVAGSCTSLAAMKLGLKTYDADRVHNSRLRLDEIQKLADHLLESPIGQIEREFPFLDPSRAEVISAGALICHQVSQRVGQAMIVRETDILDGVALDSLRSLAKENLTPGIAYARESRQMKLP